MRAHFYEGVRGSGSPSRASRMGAEEPWQGRFAPPYEEVGNGSCHGGLSRVPYRDKKRSVLRWSTQRAPFAYAAACIRPCGGMSFPTQRHACDTPPWRVRLAGGIGRGDYLRFFDFLAAGCLATCFSSRMLFSTLGSLVVMRSTPSRAAW